MAAKTTKDTKTANDSEVRALLDSRVDACRAKDIDRLMSLYSPDIVYFDVVPPLHIAGAEAIRRNFLRWFDGYEGPIDLETHDLTVAASASADAAFAHMLHRDSGARKNGMEREMWLRSTVCCRRSGDTWLITHEHISLPIAPDRY
ncbi:YybH family protein [Streptomyces iconiensis]|uniref:Nuclear transport factor 2 family protein n=1 Tax=Streptomyces iconiensis TaxID=1384038 RepID=A0ABT7A0G8_9ACTN|nr:nuclear transport factor 2 family protein [Streptomyces iconiensis]MDJ1134815.1 nuclear transport factor 2 family protein [Streptomyces iconiensis]